MYVVPTFIIEAMFDSLLYTKFVVVFMMPLFTVVQLFDECVAIPSCDYNFDVTCGYYCDYRFDVIKVCFCCCKSDATCSS
jgi:hypothetical protein